MFNSIVTRIKEASQGPEDRARLYLRHPGMRDEMVVHLRPSDLFSPLTISSRLEAVLQSDDTLKASEPLEVDVGILHAPRAAGARGDGLFSVTGDKENNSQHDKKSIVCITREGKLCMARAVCVALAKIDADPCYRNLIHPDRSMYTGKNYQLSRATALMQEAGLPLDRPVALWQTDQLAQAAKCQILVVCPEKFNKISHVSKDYSIDSTRPKKVYLYYAGGHCDAIVNICGFMGGAHYCFSCEKAFNDRFGHSCNVHCPVCGDKDCQWRTGTMDTIQCGSCNLTCRSAGCYRRHKADILYEEDHKRAGEVKRKAACGRRYKCLECNVTFLASQRPQSEHVCGQHICLSCGRWVDDLHHCFMQRGKSKGHSGKYVFFDIGEYFFLYGNKILGHL